MKEHNEMGLERMGTHSESCYKWHLECAVSRYEALRARVADLSMLVRRLSRYAPPGPAGDALDYLKRHGLEGSPMRDAGNKPASLK